MATTIQIRRDTSVNWTTTNPILASGEMGLETDTGKVKIGDGVLTFTALGYTSDPTAITKADLISVAQAVDLDAMQADITANSAKISYTDASAVALNTAKETYPATDATKVGFLTVTAPVDLDNITVGAPTVIDGGTA